MGAFIISDGLGVVPVESISFQGEEIELGMEKSIEIREKVEKVMQYGDCVKRLCQDRYTEEVWLEKLKILD